MLVCSHAEFQFSNIFSLPPVTRQERLKTTRRRNSFLLPVSIVGALLVSAIFYTGNNPLQETVGPSN